MIMADRRFSCLDLPKLNSTNEMKQTETQPIETQKKQDKTAHMIDQGGLAALAL